MSSQMALTDMFDGEGFLKRRKRKVGSMLDALWVRRAQANCAALLLKELERDMWVYDPRNWREAGITAEEIEQRYGAATNEAMQPGRFPVLTAERSLRFILPTLKNSFDVPVHVVVERLLRSKKRNLHRLARHWEDQILASFACGDEDDLAEDSARNAYCEWVRVLALLGQEAPAFSTLRELSQAAKGGGKCMMRIHGPTFEERR